MKFVRGSYGSVSFKRNGCVVTAFESSNPAHNLGWCLQIGGNTYTGFISRRDAVTSVGRFI